MKRRFLIWALASTPAIAAAQLASEPVAPPRDVLNLSASAAVEVQYDSMSITLAATREGTDATGVQTQLRQAIDAALNEAHRAAKPGQLEVRTGGARGHQRAGERSTDAARPHDGERGAG
jgi:predicted secreted protein